MSARKKKERVPHAQTSTLRQQILLHLREGPCTARDLSQLVGIREKDVVPHLEHIQKSLKSSGEHLQLEPASCQACGYIFKTRKRLDRPGSCPRCRATRIDPPVYRVTKGSDPYT